MASNWRAAISQLVRDALVCPKCGAWNRPGVAYVTLDDRTLTAVCSVCGYAWRLDLV